MNTIGEFLQNSGKNPVFFCVVITVILMSCTRNFKENQGITSKLSVEEYSGNQLLKISFENHSDSGYYIPLFSWVFFLNVTDSRKKDMWVNLYFGNPRKNECCPGLSGYPRNESTDLYFKLRNASQKRSESFADSASKMLDLLNDSRNPTFKSIYDSKVLASSFLYLDAGEIAIDYFYFAEKLDTLTIVFNNDNRNLGTSKYIDTAFNGIIRKKRNFKVSYPKKIGKYYLYDKVLYDSLIFVRQQ